MPVHPIDLFQDLLHPVSKRRKLIVLLLSTPGDLLLVPVEPRPDFLELPIHLIGVGLQRVGLFLPFAMLLLDVLEAGLGSMDILLSVRQLLVEFVLFRLRVRGALLCLLLNLCLQVGNHPSRSCQVTPNLLLIILGFMGSTARQVFI